jgi:hypothetical protein
MSDKDLKDELERLRAENAALKKGTSSSVRMKVSEKGAVSVYGMGRFPVTLYKLKSDEFSLVFWRSWPGAHGRRSIAR